jgi:hypothetical protein
MRQPFAETTFLQGRLSALFSTGNFLMDEYETVGSDFNDRRGCINGRSTAKALQWRLWQVSKTGVVG